MLPSQDQLKLARLLQYKQITCALRAKYVGVFHWLSRRMRLYTHMEEAEMVEKDM